LTGIRSAAQSAPEVLLRAIEAHGGQERFEATERVSADLRASGLAFSLRFQRGAFARFTHTVSTKEPRAVLAPHPGQGKRGVLENGDVRIETDNGKVIEERKNARAAFGGRRNLWWDDLDVTYFGGYAWWGYVVAPFIFTRPDFEVEEIEPWREDGESWRGLRVLFPDDLPAHSREQRYYFGDDGLLRRHDYTAEVFGSWAKAAHYCYDHRSFSGLVVPTRRRVMPRRRNGRPVEPVKVVSILFHDVTLRPRSDAGTVDAAAPPAGRRP
jgi:hypothetical protein